MSFISSRIFPALAALAIAVPAKAHDTGLPHVLHEYGSWVALVVSTVALLGACAVLVHIMRNQRRQD